MFVKIKCINTVTSLPSPLRNPAHSSEIYEAPTHKVLPGLYGSENKSSLKS